MNVEVNAVPASQRLDQALCPVARCGPSLRLLSRLWWTTRGYCLVPLSLIGSSRRLPRGDLLTILYCHSNRIPFQQSRPNNPHTPPRPPREAIPGMMDMGERSWASSSVMCFSKSL